MMRNVHKEMPVRSSNATRLEPKGHTERGYELSFPNQPFKELLMEVLHRGAAFRFMAKGFSMSPFIKDGDVITVASTSNDRPRFGDVAVFVNPDTERLVIHRIVGKGSNFHLSIKGDNLPTRKHLVPVSQILGRVKRVERNGRAVSLGLGPEKALIAFLSRRRLLLPLLVPVWRIGLPMLRRFVR
jgi:signal peptidase I